MSEREQIICELYGDSKGFLTPARLAKYSLLLKNVATNELINFSVFAEKYRKEYQNTDALLFRATMEWNKIVFLKMREKGLRFFNDVDTLAAFCKEIYRGTRLCNGGTGSGFLESTIISVDANGVLRNECVLENGVFQRLTSDEETHLFEYLLEHQEKIGVVQIKTRESEVKQAQLAVNNVNLLPADPDAPIEMSDEARARLRLGLSALAANMAKRA